MKLTIYTECPTEVYFQPLRYLQEQKKIKLEIIDSRLFYLPLLKLKLFLKREKKEYIKGSVFSSWIAPIKLLFSDKILLGFSPYSNAVYYLLFLKLIKKDLIYYTSWPHWDQKRGRSNWFWNRFLWRLFLKKTKKIGVNDACAKVLDNIEVIYHSVDTELFKPEKKRLNVLYVGRLEEEKGILDLITLSEEFKNITFTFVGNGKLKPLIKGDNIEYFGEIWNREKLANVFNQSSIFVLNSYKTENWEEVFGLSVLEAMSSGLAVISTDCIGPKRIITNGEDGFLIPQRNINILRDKLNLVIKDNKIRERLGKNGRKKVLENYDIKKIGEKWEKFLSNPSN